MKQQSLTKQLRLQEKISNENGKNPILHINEGAKLSKPLQNSSFEISTYSNSSIIIESDNTKVSLPKVASPVEQYENTKKAQDEAEWKRKVEMGLTG